MKKSFFAGIGVCVLGFLVLLVAFYAMYMNSGTRLLYENSVWGARWRSYPWVFLAAAVVLAVGGVLMKVGYVPKAKRPKKVHPTVVPKMPTVESYTGSVDEREPVSASTAESVNAPETQSAEPVAPMQGYAGFTLQFGAEEPSSSDREEVPAQKGAEVSAPAAHTSFDLSEASGNTSEAPQASVLSSEDFSLGQSSEEFSSSLQEDVSVQKTTEASAPAVVYTGFDLGSTPERVPETVEVPQGAEGLQFGSGAESGFTQTYGGFNLVNEPNPPEKIYTGFDLNAEPQISSAQQVDEGFTLQQALQRQADTGKTSERVCPVCGARSGENAAFCSSCGAKLS